MRALPPTFLLLILLLIQQWSIYLHAQDDKTPPLRGQVLDGPVVGADIQYQSSTTTITGTWNNNNMVFSDPETGIKEYHVGVGTTSSTPDVTGYVVLRDASTYSFTGLNLKPGTTYYFLVRAYNNVGLSTLVSSDGVTVWGSGPALNGAVMSVDSFRSDYGQIQAQSYVDRISAAWYGFYVNETAHPVVPQVNCIIPRTSTSCESFFGYRNDADYSVEIPLGDLNTISGNQTAINGQPTVFLPGTYKNVFSVLHLCTSPVMWTLNQTQAYSQNTVTPKCEAGCDGVLLSGATNDACGVCNGGGSSCGTVIPILDCVTPIKNSVPPQCVAHFGYDNQASSTVTIPIGAGNRLENAISVSNLLDPASRQQPTTFYPGLHKNQFSVVFECSQKLDSMVWTLKTDSIRTATATSKNRTACVGCDGFLDSNKVLDRCGVCGGDGQSCSFIISQVSSTNNTGIAAYHIGVGKTPTNPNTSPFRDIGINKAATISNLNLSSGTYYFIVRAVSHANQYFLAASNPVIVDPTPPVLATVYDGATTNTDATSQNEQTSISANWPGIIDPESGIRFYTIAIGTTPYGIDVVGTKRLPNNVTSTTETGLCLEPGTTYYVTITATNNAGMTTTACSNGILVNNPAPGTPKCASAAITAVNSDKYENGTYYLSNPGRFGGTLQASDPDNGITSMLCGIGSNPYNADILPLQPSSIVTHGGLSSTNCQFANATTSLLVSGYKYYLFAAATNGLNISNVKSAGPVVIDTSPPYGSVIHGLSDEQNFQVNLSQLSVHWNITDDESGMDIIELAIGTQPNATDVKDYTTILSGAKASTTTSYTVTNLELQRNGIYYVSLRVTNKAQSVYYASTTTGLFVGAKSLSIGLVNETQSLTYIHTDYSVTLTIPAQATSEQREVVLKAVYPEDFAKPIRFPWMPDGKYKKVINLATYFTAWQGLTVDELPISANISFVAEVVNGSGTFNFRKPVQLQVKYSANNLNERIDRSQMRLVYYDTITEKWVPASKGCEELGMEPAPPSNDFVNKIYTEEVCHFTQFSLFGKNRWAPYVKYGGITFVSIGIVVLVVTVFIVIPLMVFCCCQMRKRIHGSNKVSNISIMPDEPVVVVTNGKPMPQSKGTRGGRGGARGGRGGGRSGGKSPGVNVKGSMRGGMTRSSSNTARALASRFVK